MTESGLNIPLGNRTISVDAPHLVFITAIAGWCAWFCQDSWSAQKSAQNLILIVPASAAALILYIVVAAGCFHVVDRAERNHSLSEGRDFSGDIKIAGTMAMLFLYAVAAPLVGFDVGSFIYILVMLIFLGERRVAVLILFPILFCAVVIYAFATILDIPLPLLFIAGEAP